MFNEFGLDDKSDPMDVTFVLDLSFPEKVVAIAFGPYPSLVYLVSLKVAISKLYLDSSLSTMAVLLEIFRYRHILKGYAYYTSHDELLSQLELTANG